MEIRGAGCEAAIGEFDEGNAAGGAEPVAVFMGAAFIGTGFIGAAFIEVGELDGSPGLP